MHALRRADNNISSNEHQKLILIIKCNHQIPNMVIEPRSTLDATMIIDHCNTNVRYQKTVVGNLGTAKMLLETR